MCVCVCVCVCARARARACVCACVRACVLGMAKITRLYTNYRSGGVDSELKRVSNPGSYGAVRDCRSPVN